ncbi:MAG TPA: glycosyltransferase family 2 protein [Lacibacter sp.]|nr:glycosyltransferase family 2 protein [Lacibacter sp.]HMO89698.1 glycosyltransferase family 2 protein [Lacibacter sp.]HMP88320.1 glycosyltransferase family 2 protein [Lacibacter sp.]
MDLSIIIPLKDEAESLPELCAWIERVVRQEGYAWEVILVDDGSTDNSWEVIRRLGQQNPAIRGIRFRRNYGKSAALNEGFKAATGNVVITMDADLQDSPDEIPSLYRMITEGGYDLVSGWKKKRYDNTLTKNLPSKLFNAATRHMSGIRLHDFNCGLKSYSRKVVKSVEVYGEMHRYIPVLAKWAGFRNIGEKVVEHRKRKYGTTKFGWTRFVNGFLDLATILFVGRFGKRPMHFFGLWGTLCFLLGFAISIYLVVAKLVFADYSLTNKPGFFLALAFMVIGTQLFLAGFIGELVTRNAPERNFYLIDETIGLPAS